MSKFLRAIIKRYDENYGHVCNISNRLEQMQKHVDGYIEAVTLTYPGKGKYVILCDEEGRLKGKPYNCTIDGYAFVGDIVVLGVDSVSGEDFEDCPLSMKEWKALL